MKYRLYIKRHYKKIVVSIGLAIVLVWFLVWAASPHQGSIALPTTVTSGTTEAVADKTLDGTYITFNYNGTYMVSTTGPKNNELEMHTLNADTHYDKQIIVSVSNLPDGQLSTYGAYIYRKLHPELYGSRQVVIDGTQADMWMKNDGTEQTVFVPHGNKVATINFTTASANDRLTPEADTLIKTFRWKQ